LTRREADVALRPLRPKQGDLWGRKLAGVAWTVYGAGGYVDAHGLIALPENTTGIKAAEWLSATAPRSAFVYRTSSLVGQVHAAKAGIGLAALPCYLGDLEAELARALPAPVPELARELWIVTHTDLKRTARVRAFFDVVGDAASPRTGLCSKAMPLLAAGRSNSQ
jgi:DNA-binding transcriptional LysR family regulator